MPSSLPSAEKNVIEQAVQFDKENGDTLWWDAICQEMKNVRIAFEIFEGEVKDTLIGYQRLIVT